MLTRNDNFWILFCTHGLDVTRLWLAYLMAYLLDPKYVSERTSAAYDFTPFGRKSPLTLPQMCD